LLDRERVYPISPDPEEVMAAVWKDRKIILFRRCTLQGNVSWLYQEIFAENNISFEITEEDKEALKSTVDLSLSVIMRVTVLLLIQKHMENTGEILPALYVIQS